MRNAFNKLRVPPVVVDAFAAVRLYKKLFNDDAFTCCCVALSITVEVFKKLLPEAAKVVFFDTCVALLVPVVVKLFDSDRLIVAKLVLLLLTCVVLLVSFIVEFATVLFVNVISLFNELDDFCFKSLMSFAELLPCKV